MRHVALVTSAFPAPSAARNVGIGRLSKELAKGLVARGVKVTVITTFWNEGPPEEDYESIRIHRVPDASTYLGRFASLADTQYWSWGISVGNRLRTIDRPDVIHSLAPLSTTPLLVRLGFPVVTTFHHFDELWSPRELLYRPLHRILEFRAYLSSTLVSVPSKASGDLVQRRFGVPGNRVRVTPWGVDSERFHPTNTQARQGNRLLYVGPHEPRKGLPTLLEALAQLREEGLEVHLTTVGGGRQIDDLRRLAERLGVSECVQFLGHLPDPEDTQLPRIYSEADIFVFPSIMEGFGLALLEAMASGLPVVATRASAIPEVVGDAGLLVRPGSPQELAAALGTLIEHAQRRRELGAKGQRRAEARFGWSMTVSRLLDVYDEAISMGKRA